VEFRLDDDPRAEGKNVLVGAGEGQERRSHCLQESEKEAGYDRPVGVVTKPPTAAKKPTATKNNPLLKPSSF
jgi:hypothetical protein